MVWLTDVASSSKKNCGTEERMGVVISKRDRLLLVENPPYTAYGIWIACVYIYISIYGFREVYNTICIYIYINI